MANLDLHIFAFRVPCFCQELLGMAFIQFQSHGAKSSQSISQKANKIHIENDPLVSLNPSTVWLRPLCKRVNLQAFTSRTVLFTHQPSAAGQREGPGGLALLGGGQPRAGTQTFRTDLSLLETPWFPVFLLFCEVGISATSEEKNKTRESHRTQRFVYCPLFSYGLPQELSLN